MKASPSRRLKVALISGATLVVCSTIATTMVMSKDHTEPLVQDVLSAIPDTSYKVVVTPGGTQWWESLSGLLPADTELSAVDLTASGVEIQALGYAEYSDNQEPNASPARSLVIDTHTTDDAETIARWLESKPGAENRNALVQGTVLTITDSTHVPVQDPAGFSHEELTPAADRGSMWVDVSKDLSHGKDSGLASSVMPNLMGYSADAQSILTSEDGKLWSGEWTSGGFNNERVDFQKVNKALDDAQERQVVVDETTSGATNSPSISLVTGGSTDILPAIAVSDHVNDRSMGLLDVNALSSDRPVATQGELTAVFDRRALNAYMHGEEWRAEVSAYVSYALTEKGLQVAFQ